MSTHHAAWFMQSRRYNGIFFVSFWLLFLICHFVLYFRRSLSEKFSTKNYKICLSKKIGKTVIKPVVLFMHDDSYAELTRTETIPGTPPTRPPITGSSYLPLPTPKTTLNTRTYTNPTGTFTTSSWYRNWTAGGTWIPHSRRPTERFTTPGPKYLRILESEETNIPVLDVPLVNVPFLNINPFVAP